MWYNNQQQQTINAPAMRSTSGHVRHSEVSTMSNKTIPLFKRCTKCGNEYPATTENFSPCIHNKDGLQQPCRICKKKRDKEYRLLYADEIRARQEKFHREHPDSAHKASQKHYDKNKDAIHERQRIWRRNNSDKCKRWSHNWYINNKEVKRKTDKAWVENNRERVNELARRHQKNNRNYMKIACQLRRARKRNLPSDFSAQDWQRCLDYFDHRCAVCDRPVGLWHTLAQDHWIPVTKGGSYTPDNIIPLCHGTNGCNNSKHNSDPQSWLISKVGKRKASQVIQKIDIYFAWIKEIDRI